MRALRSYDGTHLGGEGEPKDKYRPSNSVNCSSFSRCWSNHERTILGSSKQERPGLKLTPDAGKAKEDVVLPLTITTELDNIFTEQRVAH